MAEVLPIISISRGELKPVFQAMLENATRLCQASFGNLLLQEGDGVRIAAMHNAPPAFSELRRRMPVFRPPEWTRDSDKPYLHIADCAEEPAYKQRHPGAVAMVELAGARTLLGVPMLNDGALIGYFALYRQEVRPFTDKQIELVQNFAAQAVIAIENARLLNELRQRTTDLTERTTDLTEALEQQTATSEVLQVISSSPGDLQPVFETMLENGVRICDAKFGGIYRIEGDTIRLVATHADVPAAYAGARRFAPFRPSPKHYFGRMMAARTVLHIADTAAEQGYVERRPEYVAAVELGGVRTFMAVPMLRENEPIGAFLLARQEIRPFTDKQIALVSNFASQAVIAIENTRLLSELRQLTNDLTESLEQQTATSEVLEVISTSSGILSRCLPACCRMQCASAAQSLELSMAGTARTRVSLQRIICRLPSTKHVGVRRNGAPVQKPPFAAWRRPKKWFTFPIWWKMRPTSKTARRRSLRPLNWAGYGRCWPFRC